MINSNNNIRTRINLVTIMLIMLFIAISYKFYSVQVNSHDYYLKEAQKLYTTTHINKGTRGEVFDINGNLLIGNAPCVNITCDPNNLHPLGKYDAIRRKKLSFIIAKNINEDYQKIYNKMSPTVPKRDKKGNPLRDENGNILYKKSRYCILAKNVPYTTAREIRKQISDNSIRGVYYDDTYIRSYPKGTLLANILGFANTALIPKTKNENVGHETKKKKSSLIGVIGIEKKFNKLMMPENGSVLYERSRDGKPLNYGVQKIFESHDGDDVYLTIDETIQSILEEELDVAFAKWRPEYLYAAIADPKTGNIIAIAQRPSFNPNHRSEELIESGNWRIKIIENILEPGSIIKPFSIGKALDLGIINPNTLIDCENGTWYYRNRPLRDSSRKGKVDVTTIVQKSSNIGTAKIALMMGDKRVYKALKTFGFGESTGLPLTPESTGYVPRPGTKFWDGLTITRAPIGYAVSATPVQMLRAYCALANNGYLPKLRLVDRIVDTKSGKTTIMPIEKSVQTFNNPNALNELIDMMVKVTQVGGTARKAAIPGYLVAGKTGTSRKNINGRYLAGKYYSSFCGFAPAKRAKLVMVITMDSPKGAIYGGATVAPVFKNVMERSLRYYNIPPDPALLGEVAKQ